LRVVLDSNVILSGFFFAGIPGIILQGWRAGRFRLALSPSILSEYREAGVALESRYGGSEFDAFAALLALHADIVDAPEHLDDPVCSDPDDDKFLACALAAGAEIIVSGDKELVDVSGWRGIEVLRPRTFVEKYLSDQPGGAS
jgi:uncharacterized protein